MIVSTRAKICSSFIPMNASIAGYVTGMSGGGDQARHRGRAEKWLKLNADYAKTWPNITVKRDPPADSKEWEGKPDKLKYFSPNPAQVTSAPVRTNVRFYSNKFR